MADWNRFSKKKFLENLYKGQNLKVRKFQIHRTLESKVIKRKPTGGAHGRVKPTAYKILKTFISKYRKGQNIYIYITRNKHRKKYYKIL